MMKYHPKEAAEAEAAEKKLPEAVRHSIRRRPTNRYLCSLLRNPIAEDLHDFGI